MLVRWPPAPAGRPWRQRPGLSSGWPGRWRDSRAPKWAVATSAHAHAAQPPRRRSGMLLGRSPSGAMRVTRQLRLPPPRRCGCHLEACAAVRGPCRSRFLHWRVQARPWAHPALAMGFCGTKAQSNLHFQASSCKSSLLAAHLGASSQLHERSFGPACLQSTAH
jgi:hypothetical protein